MASIIDIDKCFETYLKTYATDQSVEVAYEGTNFDPEEGVLYLDPSFLVSPPTQKELIGANTRDRVEGYYQINVVSKAGTGKHALYAQYEGLQGVFNRGTALTYTNDSGEEILVEINKFYMSDLDESNSPWMFLPVFIQWRSDIWVG